MATNKLLHERLREIADEDSAIKPFDLMSVELGMEVPYTIKMQDSVLRKLADEIERFYIPRPRFEDGEPVQFRDEVEECSGPVNRMLFFADGTGYLCGINDSTYTGTLFDIDRTPQRRVPKVLDADGVPIEVDDIVYRLGDPRRLKVADPHYAKFDNYCIVECVVLDDGRHLGDYPDADAVTYAASKLTHKEPNSLEKLLERMEDYAQKNEGYIDGSKVGDFSKELRAIMERGA